MSKDHEVLVIVARMLVKVDFTAFGVLVIVGRKTEGVTMVDASNVMVLRNVLVEVESGKTVVSQFSHTIRTAYTY